MKKNLVLTCLCTLLLFTFSSFKYNESKLAHKFLDGLKGIEIGAAAHNPFGLNTLNIDYTDQMTSYKKEEIKNCGTYAKVDIIASGDELPLEDNSVDFVVSSQVLQHFYNPIKAVKEWLRVVKPGGYVFMIVPHKERITFNKSRPRTTLDELLNRYEYENLPVEHPNEHYSVWVTQDIIELCDFFHWTIVHVDDVDDKVGNGFTIILRK